MSRVLFGSTLILVCLLRCDAASFTFCKTSGANADECLARSIESAVRSLKSGVPEYGLMPFDPLPVDKITIDAGSGAVKLVQFYRNLHILGFSDITVTKAHYNEKRKTLVVEANFPKVSQLGEYTINGAILSLPVTGDGNSSLILEDTKILASVKFEETKRDGQTFFKIKSLGVSIAPKKMRLNFENLFNGNKLLGDNINNLINEEWDALYNDVRPSTEKNYAELLKNYAQHFFDRVPADQIFIK